MIEAAIFTLSIALTNALVIVTWFKVQNFIKQSQRLSDEVLTEQSRLLYALQKTDQVSLFSLSLGQEESFDSSCPPFTYYEISVKESCDDSQTA